MKYNYKSYTANPEALAGNKLTALFLKKPLCTGDLSPAHKIFIERPGQVIQTQTQKKINLTETVYS